MMSRGEEWRRARTRGCDDVQLEAQCAAKLEALGRLAGDMAHEFSNILGTMLGYGELARDALDESSKVRRYVDQVIRAGFHGKRIVERILGFAHTKIGTQLPLCVQSIIEETLDLIEPLLGSKVHLRRQLNAADATIEGDVNQLYGVVMNLCTNAVHAMARGGVLTVELERVGLPERCVLSHGRVAAGRYLRLSVSDTGVGISPAVLQRMFDPFFTTKRVGEGTGLGLALVRAIATDLGGVIDVSTQLGEGTTFSVWLPHNGEIAKASGGIIAEVPQAGDETIMIVDSTPLPGARWHAPCASRGS